MTPSTPTRLSSDRSGDGALVSVKHVAEWPSASGHNRARLVNEGQVVKAGEQIAELGRSGAARDMLHVEIRYNGNPVDPRAYLPKHCRSGPCAFARSKAEPYAHAHHTEPDNTFHNSPTTHLNRPPAAAFHTVSIPH